MTEGKLWKVIGGADKGGVIVRSACDLTSPKLPERLSTGALVEEVELKGERLFYKKRLGSGPELGWLSIRLGPKELVTPLGDDDKEALLPAAEADEATEKRRVEVATFAMG
mmetsp:Transcript_52367/g.93986  ORF Transcript_52367/g.93986 Transcript_52367/m.93986 type:complete len:111 (-) Transcript_52367:21-353(-)